MKIGTSVLLLGGLGLIGLGALKIYDEEQNKKIPNLAIPYKPNYAIPVLMIGGGLALTIPALEKLL